MKKLLLCAAVALVTGCAARNHVLTQKEWADLDMRDAGAATFSLPRLTTTFTYALEEKTFRQGKHDKVVNFCAADVNTDDILCRALRAVGITKSLRLSKKPKDKYCATDGMASEVRVSLAGGAALTTGTEPDSSQVYLIPLNRSYFQTFDFSLELNADGTVGKGSLSTENLGAQDFITGISQLATTFLRIAVDAPETPYQTERDAAAADAKELEDLLARKAKLVNEEADEPYPSRTALIAALDASVGARKARFVGTVTTKAIPRDPAHWVPMSRDDAWVVTSFDACGEEAGKRWQQAQTLQLFVHVLQDAYADASVVGDTGKSKALGWPYRVPAAGKVVFGQCTVAPSLDGDDAATKPATPTVVATTCDSARSMADNTDVSCSCLGGVRVPIPQLGVVRRLPQATGGRKSAISPEYYPDGSLKKVTIAHIGESPAPLITAAKTLLTPEPDPVAPTELQTLQAETALIHARQALCRLVHNVEATDPTCQGPNPPTALE